MVRYVYAMKFFELKIREAATPPRITLASFLGLEEPSLKIFHLAKLFILEL